MIIESLEPGTVLGWSWLFPPYEWRFGAVAAEPFRGLAFDAESVRSMRWGVGWCGHCRLGPWPLCRDGPVVSYLDAAPPLSVKEL